MEITYQYTKRRGTFGRQTQFCEQGPEMCDSIPPDVARHKEFILRNPVHQLTQNAPVFSQADINTIRAEITTSGVNHAEGGWPLDVNVGDPEATHRYCRRIEKDDNYIHCVMSVAPDMEHYLLQNNAIDMYDTYYSEMPVQPTLERITSRTVNEYREPDGASGGSRPISSVCWQPDGGHRFAATYNEVDFNRISTGSMYSYVWNVENANRPEVRLDPPCPLLDLQYNGRDPNVLAGGLMSGQVAIFDQRSGGKPTALSAPHVAHRDLVRSVVFVNAKSGQEFFSSGPDGVCKWWDIRNMEDYIDEMIIDFVKSVNDVPSMGTSHGVCTLEFEPTIPTRFMVGTEDGLVVCGNRKGKTPFEKLPAKFEAHTGPVWSLERNPSFLKNFLTVGDWTARVWSEECRESAVVWSPPLRHKITAGTWSPTRLSLMVLTQWNGVLAMWDLLRRQHEPVLTMQVCHEPLIRLKIHEGGALAACGSRNGNIYMVEMSHNLVQSDKNDKQLLTAMFERESKRERILEARMREIRLKMRQAEEGSPAASLTEVDVTAGDRDLAEATTDYFAVVKKEAAAL